MSITRLYYCTKSKLWLENFLENPGDFWKKNPSDTVKTLHWQHERSTPYKYVPVSDSRKSQRYKATPDFPQDTPTGIRWRWPLSFLDFVTLDILCKETGKVQRIIDPGACSIFWLNIFNPYLSMKATIITSIFATKLTENESIYRV